MRCQGERWAFTRGEGVQVLMSLPSWIVPVQDVHDGVRKIVQHMRALISINHQVEIRGLEMYRPSL